MLTIVRGGPRILMVRARSAAWDEFLKDRFGAIPYSARDAIDVAMEGQTIFLCTGGEGMVRHFRAYVCQAPADELLCHVMNEDRALVHRIIPIPRILSFRYFGDYRRVFDQIRLDFDATQGKLRHVLRKSSDLGVAVVFTKKSLNRPLRRSDIEDDVLYIRQPFEAIHATLRSRGLDYFNEGLERKDWNDIEIRMYDMDGFYDLHVRRMRIAMNALEIGLILGEGWGKDYAHILMPVRVYRIRILTFLTAPELKRIMMGLEYDSDGERFVDLDVYLNKRKIGWGDIPREQVGKRRTLGNMLREDLASRLIPAEWNRLRDAENEIAARKKNPKGTEVRTES